MTILFGHAYTLPWTLPWSIEGQCPASDPVVVRVLLVRGWGTDGWGSAPADALGGEAEDERDVRGEQRVYELLADGRNDRQQPIESRFAIQSVTMCVGSDGQRARLPGVAPVRAGCVKSDFARWRGARGSVRDDDGPASSIELPARLDIVWGPSPPARCVGCRDLGSADARSERGGGVREGAVAQRSADARIAWKGCGKGLQCARVRVPLDWARPGMGTISLAVIRHRASGPGRRIGSLFLNFGGPGVPGVSMVKGASESDLDAGGVGGRFDLVSWDPRGTGGVHPRAVFCREFAPKRGSGALTGRRRPRGESRCATYQRHWRS